jgi:Uma2 family endonuclease
MTPDDINTHGTPKSAIAGEFVARIQDRELGIVGVDCTRLSSPDADLSAEPDVLVLLVETIRSGRARLVPGASEKPDRHIEIEGAADIVVEVISKHSQTKDRKRLRTLYHAAGVREYWIVDARGGKTELEVLIHSESGYSAAPVDAEGFSMSSVLGKRVRLVRGSEVEGLCFFRLECRDPLGA